MGGPHSAHQLVCAAAGLSRERQNSDCLGGNEFYTPRGLHIFKHFKCGYTSRFYSKLALMLFEEGGKKLS